MTVTGRSVPSTQLEPPRRERSRSAPPMNVQGKRKGTIAYSVYGAARRGAYMQVWGDCAKGKTYRTCLRNLRLRLLLCKCLQTRRQCCVSLSNHCIYTSMRGVNDSQRRAPDVRRLLRTSTCRQRIPMDDPNHDSTPHGDPKQRPDDATMEDITNRQTCSESHG